MVSGSKQSEQSKTKNFPVVAIGASAGGLEAFETFFKATPEDCGMAFILVAHLDPTHASLLPELLQKRTKMPVHQITDGTVVAINNIYVIPPNKNLAILQGKLQLLDLSTSRGVNLPIDSFFSSLAQDQGSNGIAIILSGTGSDGTQGIKAIKAENGMVMVQDEGSAKYNGMPRSAAATGLADYVHSPDEMPKILLRYINHSFKKNSLAVIDEIDEEKDTNYLEKIFIILRTRTGHDFSMYKKNTIFRRIERRMNIHQISEIKDYVHYLQKSEREAGILFKELLIGVTNFFRDSLAFDHLLQNDVPDMLANKPDDYTIRVWVAGCSSGEEAYSLAIILLESMDSIKRHFNVQIFATDIDEGAIEVARTGLYAASVLSNVSTERLKRFFSKEDDEHFRIKKSIREMLVFAPHDIIKDPPFTKLDILSCRNLLIYFNSELQKKLFPVFHYSLKPDGILFLGTSESIGQSSELFQVRDKKFKIFTPDSSGNPKHKVPDFPAMQTAFDKSDSTTTSSISRAEKISALQLVETILHKSHTPPCAIIDDDNNIVYIHGRTGRYLEPAEGRISVNILDMARPGLKSSLSLAIVKVAQHKIEVIMRNIEVQNNDERILLDVTVMPVVNEAALNGLLMVVFEEKTKPQKSVKGAAKTEVKASDLKSNEELQQELQFTKQNLQTTIEELETANEELKSTNEELQSTNEELQSTNEEMETSKEELQSLNEESITVNSELQSRIDELTKTNDDMKNLLDSTDIATLFLDINLCIRRFTPKATEIIPLSATDTGRPISHFATSLQGLDLNEYCTDVLNDLAMREVEAKTRENRIYEVKIRPYRTINNVIDGVVVTFEDISVRKKVDRALNDSEQLYRMLFQLSSSPMLLIADTGKIIESNHFAYDLLEYSKEEFLDLSIQSIGLFRTTEESTKYIDKIIECGEETILTSYKNKNGDEVNLQIKGQAIQLKEHLRVLISFNFL
jgi:two-component system, chemotaxis family, CheB/CheR fusion protein